MSAMSEWYQIESESFVVQLTSKGAELKRLFSRKWNKELLWSGDESVWGRSAPHLFPIVGKLKDDQYELRGKTYKLSQHGFSRDMEFSLVSQSTSRVELSLSATGETFKSYPFCFKMNIIYELVSNKLEITYKIINDDRQEIYFSVGAHPGFLTADLRDYTLKFERDEKQFFRLKDGLVDFENPFVLNAKTLNLTKELFSSDALIFEQTTSKYIDLINQKEDQVIRLNFDSPYFGIWGKGNVPFVCLEPWFGVGDTCNHDKNFLTKKGLVTLPQNEEFMFKYSIETRSLEE